MAELIKSVKGVNGQVVLFSNRLEITRKGFKSFLSHGMDGTKIIFLKSITGIQFKEAGAMTNGFMQFIFMGSQESKLGFIASINDENSIVFNKKEQSDFEEIKQYIINFNN